MRLSEVYELYALGIGSLTGLAIVAIVTHRWLRTALGQRFLRSKWWAIGLTAEFAFAAVVFAKVLH